MEHERYFTGSNSGLHLCECASSGTCSNSADGHKCNCDARHNRNESDSGIITDMGSLPVMKFLYGNMRLDHQMASIKIGPLVCKGRKEIPSEEIYDSCKNLKIESGERRTGNYALNSGIVSFCDMGKALDDPLLETPKDVVYVVTLYILWLILYLCVPSKHLIHQDVCLMI